jgi:2-methylcitrate dehydratase
MRTEGGPCDEVADALAAFVVEADRALEPEVIAAARLILLDSLAVALGALDHPATAAAHRYARLLQVTDGCRIWGSALRTNAETAALVNGVPLRAYDFNDLYMSQSGGHPSDIVPGVVAVAEWRGASGRDVIDALAVGYEVALALLDTIDLERKGWDYVNCTGLAATCAIATLMKLPRQQLVEALAITVIPHAASNEVESGDLNSRGDLTMWKRFNGSDAVRHAVYACTLSSVGVEGAVRPFLGSCGFLTLIDDRPTAREALLGRLARRRRLGSIREVTMKRWPVGSRAQSAIQAALDARRQIRHTDDIREVRVATQKGIYEHLVARRQAPWTPHSRETADHSLPYIVAAAVLDGVIQPSSFDPGKVCDPVRQAFLQKVRVAVDADLDKAPAGQMLSRVEIETVDGKVLRGEASPPPGHPSQPFTEADVIDKLNENAMASLGKPAITRLVEAVNRLDKVDSINDLVQCLVR